MGKLAWPQHNVNLVESGDFHLRLQGMTFTELTCQEVIQSIMMIYLCKWQVICSAHSNDEVSWVIRSSTMLEVKWPAEWLIFTAVSSLSPVNTQTCSLNKDNWYNRLFLCNKPINLSNIMYLYQQLTMKTFMNYHSCTCKNWPKMLRMDMWKDKSSLCFSSMVVRCHVIKGKLIGFLNFLAVTSDITFVTCCSFSWIHKRGQNFLTCFYSRSLYIRETKPLVGYICNWHQKQTALIRT